MIKTDLNYTSSKILSLDNAANLVSNLKSRGKKVGLCHGGFDLLHPGHIRHFELAKKICDVLFVSITTDKFVRQNKGDGRPIFSEKLRGYSIANIVFVDYVVLSDFKTGIEPIKTLKPSYYIKGPDYIDKDGDEALKLEIESIKSVGGSVKFTQEPKTISSTELITHIKSNNLS